MSSASKFQFDTVFDLDEKGRARRKAPDPTFSEQEVLAARAEAQQLGFDAGAAQARREIENAAAGALQNIAGFLPTIAERHQRVMLEIKEDAARLAHVIAAKLAPALIARSPEQEIENLLSQCLETMMEEPRLVIRLPEALMDHLPEALEQVAAQSGFAGKLVIIGEPGLSGGDCRIEWADGGAERDLRALMAKVDGAIEHYCAAVHDQADRLAAAEQAAAGSPAAAGPDAELDPASWPAFQEAPGGIDEPLPTVSTSRTAAPASTSTTTEPPANPAAE